MDDERETTCAELLDEEVAEEVIVAREVAHVHDLGGPPTALEDGRAGARRGRHCGGGKLERARRAGRRSRGGCGETAGGGSQEEAARERGSGRD